MFSPTEEGPIMRPEWVTACIAQLVRQFCSNKGNEAWIGIASLDGFGGVLAGGLWRRGGRFEVLSDIGIADGFVWRPDRGPDGPELWLSPTKTGYRDAYERFARRYLGASGLTGADVQIDHVFPKKAGALGGLAYVRMLAIPPESNMAAGRTLEREMVARNADFGARGKLTRMATYFSIGKATGFVGYERLPDDGASAINGELSAALIAYLRGFGLPADVLTALDQNLTAHTAGRLR
jgi:hypothetical protein